MLMSKAGDGEQDMAETTELTGGAKHQHSGGSVPELQSLATRGKYDQSPTSVTNVLSEFVVSAYRGSVGRSIDSTKQIAGLQPKAEQPQEHLSGLMKASNIAGTATGEILDFLILNKLAASGAGKLVEAAGETSLAARVLAEGSVSRAITTSAAVGFVNGAVLTPLQNNESAFRRLGNGLVDAASFAALGGVGAKYAGKLGDGMLGRAGVNAISGIAGGATNSLLDPISHGRAPEASQVVENAAAWGLGGVVAGEAMRVGAKGLSVTAKQLVRIGGGGGVVGGGHVGRSGNSETTVGVGAPQVRQESMVTDKSRGTKWTGASSAIARGMTLIDVADVPHANPEVTKAQSFQNDSSESAPWNRTATQHQRYRSLEGRQEADVVVVGGGVVGLQTAHELGSHGISTVVLDKGLVGSGTSRFMGAMGTYAEDSGFKGIYDVHGPAGFSSRLRALQSSRASVQQLARQYGADWQNVHSFNVSYDENDAALKEEVELLHRFNDLAPEFVTGDAASKIFAPAKSAVIFPNEGNLNPYKFSLGLAASGKFAVHENSPVLGIAVGAPGDGVDVFSPSGTIHAKKVVFATNGPAPMFSFLNDHLIPVQCFATTADIGQELPGNFFDTDSNAFTYWRQFGVKPFGPTETLIGGTARFLNEMNAEPDSPRLNARVSELFDGAKPKNPVTAVIFTAYSDGLPVAGPHPQYPDVWTATGAGGTGLVNGNLMARTIRQQLQTPSEENLVSPTRFAN
jgi:glycine/D-amino acid oxidase-like deaminating enzyme